LVDILHHEVERVLFCDVVQLQGVEIVAVYQILILNDVPRYVL